MKIRKIILSLSLFCMTITPLHAREYPSILILSKELPYLIYIQQTADTKISVNFLPSDIYIPLSCVADTPAPLSSLDFHKNTDCIKQSVENFLNITFTHTLYLHLDRISKDTGIPLHDLDFHNLKELTGFFSKAAKKADISMILNYRQYVSGDLSLSDYYQYYKLSKKKLTITYGFMKYVTMDRVALPMDNQLYPRSHK